MASRRLFIDGRSGLIMPVKRLNTKGVSMVYPVLEIIIVIGVLVDSRTTGEAISRRVGFAWHVPKFETEKENTCYPVVN